MHEKEDNATFLLSDFSGHPRRVFLAGTLPCTICVVTSKCVIVNKLAFYSISVLVADCPGLLFILPVIFQVQHEQKSRHKYAAAKQKEAGK